MKLDLEQIKVDREGREGENWVKMRTGIETSEGEDVCTAPLGFKRRIARVPDMEAALIEAVDLLRKVADVHVSGVIADVEEFLERFE